MSMRAQRDYRPGLYRGDVLVLRARVQAFLHRAEPDLGWGHWVEGAVDVRIVAGSHSYLLEESHVRQVAIEIARVVARR